VLEDHNPTSEGDEMQENLPHRSVIAPLLPGGGQGEISTGRGGLDGEADAEQDVQASKSSEDMEWMVLTTDSER